MDKLAIQQFNGQFENYIKDNVSGSTVRALKTIIDTNNSTDASKAITINYGEGVSATTINSADKYDISVKKLDGSDGYENGLIKNILITKHTAATTE